MPNILSCKCAINRKCIKEEFYIFFLLKSLKSNVYITLTAPLTDHMWPMATLSDIITLYAF